MPPNALLIGLVYFLANTSFLGGMAYFTTWRPLVGGFLVGLILGDPARGALAGAMVNLLYLGYLSVGGTLGIGDAALAGITGATAALALPLPPTQALGIGALAGVLLGNLGFPLLSLRMRLDNRIARRMDAAAERGDARAVAWLNIILGQALLFALTVPTGALLALAIGALSGLAAVLPAWMLAGLSTAGAGLAGLLGMALALRFVFKGWGIALFLGGYTAVSVAGSGPILSGLGAAGLAGAALAGLGILIVLGGRLRRAAGGRRIRMAPFWLWQFFSHSAYSFERLQGGGFACALAPVVARLYPDRAARAAALRRHLAFFNTEVNAGSMIVSIAAGLEEQAAAGQAQAEDAARAKRDLMGALAGFGDPVVQGAFLPLLLSLALAALLSLGGDPPAPAAAAVVALYAAAVAAVMGALSWLSYRAGAIYGREAALRLMGSRALRRAAAAAERLAALSFGALAAAHAALAWPFERQAGWPAQLAAVLGPLAIILGCHALLGRWQVKPAWALAGLTAAALLAAVLGPA
jgi:mannose/fructose/N-acetylgalactosamine-specific phosphotransferase system component IID/mannose/fructose/N-acetylgalactosamine-specific phosphotransferase system component IIC